MAWWSEILGLLREEFGATAGEMQLPPDSAKQAEVLLKRTERELLTAKARAEAARRRLLRAQDALHAVGLEASGAHFRERLTALAKSVTHESELVEVFDAHISRLSEVHDRISHELSKFARDLQMLRNVHITAAMTETVSHQKRLKPSVRAEKNAVDASPKPSPPGFRRKHDAKVLAELENGPHELNRAANKSRESGTADTSRESGTADTSRESGTADTSRESGTANTSGHNASGARNKPKEKR